MSADLIAAAVSVGWERRQVYDQIAHVLLRRTHAQAYTAMQTMTVTIRLEGRDHETDHASYISA